MPNMTLIIQPTVVRVSRLSMPMPESHGLKFDNPYLVVYVRENDTGSVVVGLEALNELGDEVSVQEYPFVWFTIDESKSE